RFDQCRPPPPVALPRLTGFVRAGTLVLAGTERGPARKMPRAGKDPHVSPHLRQDHFGRALIDPRDGIQAAQRLGERAITRSISVLRVALASSRSSRWCSKCPGPKGGWGPNPK